jgi:hypothetical protein
VPIVASVRVPANGLTRADHKPMGEKLVNTMGSNESAATCHEHFHVGCVVI